MRDLVCTCRGNDRKPRFGPRVGLSKPSNSLTVVDLPEPFGPSRRTLRRAARQNPRCPPRAPWPVPEILEYFVNPRTETTTLRIYDYDSDCGFGSTAVMIRRCLIFPLLQVIVTGFISVFLLISFRKSDALKLNRSCASATECCGTPRPNLLPVAFVIKRERTQVTKATYINRESLCLSVSVGILASSNFT